MPWQDLVFTVGQIIFLLAFIPTIRGKNKPEFTTSVVTALVLIIFVINYLSLKLWFSALASSAMSIAWAIVAYQKYIQNKN